MAESFNKNSEKRAVFRKGEQHNFLTNAGKISGLSWLLLANKLNVSERTLFDWRREKYLIPFGSLNLICRLTKIEFPTLLEIKPPYWSVKKAAKLGGIATYKKFGTIGNPKIRRENWQLWWETKGKFNINKYFVAKKIFIPPISEKLAEFAGILIGDGGITKRQVIISLNSIVDREYSIFVKEIVKLLFKDDPKVYFRKNENTMSIVVSSTNLVKFCQSLDLKVGNKLRQNLDIPLWIKKNNLFLTACIRGLMDTDGCLFFEKHIIKGKVYKYPRLSLVSASSDLRQSVFIALTKFGFAPRIRNNRCVQLESNFDIKNYFAKIGTNHPKNKEKFISFFGGFG